MFFVQCNSANQWAHLALRQGETWLNPSISPYLVRFVHENTGQEFAFIPTMIYQNHRITYLKFDTNMNTPASGKILLENPGRYAYYVYQNSGGGNLNPALAVGLIQQGFMEAVQQTETYYETPAFNTPADYIYNG